jgi:hypothetical protein
MGFLFTFADVALESSQIKVIDWRKLHLEERSAHITAVTDGLHRVGATRRLFTVGLFILTQLFPQCVTPAVTNAAVLVVARTVGEQSVVVVLESQLAMGRL